jgi:hypothetical protein
MKHAEIINRAVKEAQVVAQREGLRIGQTVAHPDEPITCELTGFGGTQLMPTGIIEYEDLRREFPLNELFDPNVAKEIALRIKREMN